MINQIKKLTLVLVALPLLATCLVHSLSARSITAVRDASSDDTAALYKSKCSACHGAKAEKNFDASKSDEALVEIVLKGNKPKMPSYEKSLNAEQAKALVAHMKQQKSAAAPAGH